MHEACRQKTWQARGCCAGVWQWLARLAGVVFKLLHSTGIPRRRCVAVHGNVHAVISIGLPRIVTFEARGHRLVATATSALAAIGCSSAAHCSCLEWREICITASGVYGPRPVRGLQLPVTLSIESTVDVRWNSHHHNRNHQFVETLSKLHNHFYLYQIQKSAVGLT